MTSRIKRSKQQKKNESNRDRHNDLQTGHGSLHIFERSAPDQTITSRQLHLFGNFGLGFADDTFDIASQGIKADIDSALKPFPADQRRALAQFDLGQLTQRNQGS